MERTLSEKEKELILNFGALEYDARRCAAILGWKEKEFQKGLDDAKSEVHRLYESGKIKAEYVIDLKLFEQAQQGDLKALEELEGRKFSRNHN